MHAYDTRFILLQAKHLGWDISQQRQREIKKNSFSGFIRIQIFIPKKKKCWKWMSATIAILPMSIFLVLL